MASAPDPYKIGVAERNDVINSDNGNEDTNAKTVRTRVINTGIRNLVLLVFGQSNCTSVAPNRLLPNQRNGAGQLQYLKRSDVRGS